jgi:hypothetical protein
LRGPKEKRNLGKKKVPIGNDKFIKKGAITGTYLWKMGKRKKFKTKNEVGKCEF